MGGTNLFVAQAAPLSSSDFGVVASQVPPREDASSPFPPFDPQYWAPQVVWLIILFGLLYLAVSKLGLPRVEGILSERRGKIGTDLGEAERARQKAEQEQAAYQKLLAEARARAQSEGQAQHEALAAQSEALRKRLDAQVGEKISAADRQIAETKARAMANVSVIARDAAASIVERLLGRAVDAGALDRAMTETLES